MTNPAHRPIYSSAQISNYFTHIFLPKNSADLPSTPAKLHEPQHAYKFVTQLQQHQLCTVPFENLSLHYSPHHTVSIDAEFLYSKIVGNGRGGYCMENNCFFGTVLRTLGFTVYSAGARVNEAGAAGKPGEVYVPWSHMVNIVTLSDGKKYMLDVGFGGTGPVRPLLLDAEQSLTQGIEPAEIRLVKRNIPQNSDPHQRLWVYEHRNDPQSDWLAMYCFTELEFLPQDYEMMNFWRSQSRKTWFTYRIVVVKMIMEEGKVVGTLILVGGDLKRRVRGKTEHLRTCKNEAQRVEALGEWFGIEFSDHEKAGIKGMVTELRE